MQRAASVLLNDGKRIEHRPVRVVVGMEFECVQEPNQHRAAVRAVGALHHSMELLAVGRAGRLELPSQVAQGLFIRNRISDSPNRLLRVFERAFSNLEEQEPMG